MQSRSRRFHHRDPCTTLLQPHPPLPPPPSILYPGNHSSVLLFHHFVISRMYVNRIMQCEAFCDWLFSIRHNPPQRHPGCPVDPSSVPLLLSRIPWCGWTTVCLTIHLLKDVGVVSGSDYYKEDCCEYLYSSCCRNISSHFSVTSAQECNC